MEPFTIEIAGATLRIFPMFGSTREYCRKYLTEKTPDHSVVVTREDLVREQIFLNQEADEEGLRRRVFADPFLERAVIQRKTAEYLLEQDTLLLHGSTLAVDGRAYLFTAKTGTGKSTHTRLWRELLGERVTWLNDDRAFLRPVPEGVIACGSPWSGKHGLDTNLSVPLAGICILTRGQENRIHPVSPEECLPELLHQAFCPGEPQREQAAQLTRCLSERVKLWHLECTKDPEAARVAYAAMSGRGGEK